MAQAFIGLGANLGNAAQTVSDAAQRLAILAGTQLVAVSPLYRSAPVGYADQPDFVNAVAAIETDLTPYALLDGLLAIEQHFGRERSFRNAPRTLDMDLLLYDQLVLHDERLTLPHPRMLERSFVLLPLADIAPDWPLSGAQTATTLAAACDQSGLQRIE